MDRATITVIILMFRMIAFAVLLIGCLYCVDQGHNFTAFFCGLLAMGTLESIALKAPNE